MRWIIMALPWLELFTLIQLGVATSALVALLYVVATFILGLTIVRHQGFSLLNQVRQQQQQGLAMGSRFLRDDMAIGFAGMLLMVPGLITDIAAGFVVLGPVRRRLMRWLSPGSSPDPTAESPDSTFTHQTTPDSRDRSSTVIDGEYTRVDKP